MYRDPELAENPPLLEQRGGAFYSEAAGASRRPSRRHRRRACGRHSQRRHDRRTCPTRTSSRCPRALSLRRPLRFPSPSQHSRPKAARPRPSTSRPTSGSRSLPAALSGDPVARARHYSRIRWSGQTIPSSCARRTSTPRRFAPASELANDYARSPWRSTAATRRRISRSLRARRGAARARAGTTELAPSPRRRWLAGGARAVARRRVARGRPSRGTRRGRRRLPPRRRGLPRRGGRDRRGPRGTGWAARTIVGNDTFAVLRAGTERGWGVAVVCGAGINCVGVAPDGRQARFPALGSITGDWGGGYDVGLAAVSAAARSEDGRGPRTSLEQAVPGATSACGRRPSSPRRSTAAAFRCAP